jgi:hypothetical protein
MKKTRELYHPSEGASMVPSSISKKLHCACSVCSICSTHVIDAASSKQQAASSKQQAASSKQQAASSKQQAASSKQQAASSKQQAVNSCEVSPS